MHTVAFQERASDLWELSYKARYYTFSKPKNKKNIELSEQYWLPSQSRHKSLQPAERTFPNRLSACNGTIRWLKPF